MAKRKSNIAPDTVTISTDSQPSAIHSEGMVQYENEVFRMIWTNIITLSGAVTTAFQLQFGETLMIIEERHWCDEHQKIHYRPLGGFSRIGPLGEPDGICFPIDNKELGIF